MKTKTNFPDFVFFGADKFSAAVLESLAAAKIFPSLIITSDNLKTISYKLQANFYKLFLVASYGKIILPAIFNLPKYGTLNIHPSLLPKYRGATPIQSAILNGDEETGVSLMLLDAELDHGPILQATSYKLASPAGGLQDRNFIELRDQLAKLGTQLFLETAPLWVTGKIKAVPQNHAQATYTKKIKKEDGEINLSQGDTLRDKGVALYRKFLAYQDWPGTYFFVDRNGKRVRVIITAAHLNGRQFIIDRVKPEGKKDMSYADFQRGFKPPQKHL